MTNIPEILAPAGNIDSLKAAVIHGADAVYFGLSEFNARIKADNFNFSNLGEWVDFCHCFDVKVYITLNVMIKEDERDRLAECIRQAVLCNVDAFIVTDLLTIKLCKEIAPSIPLHFSTQFGVHNLESARVACKLGAKRIILARETNIDEIKRIKKELDVEIEVFVHGALCVAFSGNCYASSMIDGNSGNRGRCKQPCRKLYESSMSCEKGYFLSTNDLCLVDELDELVQAGVCSLKIEGRLKNPDYVSATVTAYRNALLGCSEVEDLDRIKASYARTFCKGYLNGGNANIINPKLQNSAGLIVGEVVAVSRLQNGLNKITFSSRKLLKKNVGLKFLTKDGKERGGTTLSSSDRDGRGHYVAYLKSCVEKGCIVSITQEGFDSIPEIYPKVFVELAEETDGRYKITIKDNKGVIASLCFELDTAVLSKSGDQISGVERVLSKGFDPFVVDKVKCVLLSNTHIPFSVLNNYRKQCFSLFKKNKLDYYKKSLPNEASDFNEFVKGELVLSKSMLAVIVSSEEQLLAVYKYSDKIIYQPYDYSNEKTEKFFNRVKELGISVYLGFPVFLRQKDIEVLCKTIEKYNTFIIGVYGNNYSIIDIAEKYSLEIFRGYGFNVANNVAISSFNGPCVLSAELSEKELCGLSTTNAYVYAVGYFPLMTLVHCPIKSNLGGCDNCYYKKHNEIVYKSGGFEFKIRRIKTKECSFELYNGIPLSIQQGIKNISHNLLFDFRNFDTEEIIEVLKSFRKNSEFVVNNKTNGRFVKGVL